MSKLLQQYSQKNAAEYDARRSTSKRWANEIRAMEEMLEKIHPKTVLDCPFGTGRWIPQYINHGVKVIGIDFSEDMLLEAKKKISTYVKESGNFTLVQKSIFDIEQADLSLSPDLVVCTRFFNWVSLPDVEKAFSALSAIGSKEMVVGVSVRPTSLSIFKNYLFRLGLLLKNKRKFKKAPQFVHDEIEIVKLFERFGWSISRQAEIFRNKTRFNYFYHLSR